MNSAFVVLLCVSALLSAINAETTLYEAGARKTGDQLLTRSNINERFRLGQIVTKDYTFNAPSVTSVITYIKITSTKTRKAGTATLSSGGVGTSNAAFHFQSRRGFGLRATVEIYGLP